MNKYLVFNRNQSDVSLSTSTSVIHGAENARALSLKWPQDRITLVLYRNISHEQLLITTYVGGVETP